MVKSVTEFHIGTISEWHRSINRTPYWQTFLNWYSKGEFFKKCGTSDRYFGDNTKKWTEKFQKETGLTVDGIVGTKTLAKAKAVKRSRGN